MTDDFAAIEAIHHLTASATKACAALDEKIASSDPDATHILCRRDTMELISALLAALSGTLSQLTEATARRQDELEALVTRLTEHTK